MQDQCQKELGMEKTKQAPNFSLRNVEMGNKNRNRTFLAVGGQGRGVPNSEVQLLKS